MSNSTTTSSAKYSTLSQLLGFEPGDFVSVATDKVKRATTMSVEDLDADYAMGLLDQKDTWIGAQPVKPGTRSFDPNIKGQFGRVKASDVALLRVLYADFDKKDATSDIQILDAIEQLSDQLGTAPISIVHSGGGYHPRWKLEKPIDPDDAKGVLTRWQITVQRVAEENGFKADSVFDLPRVLRMPGTVNEKYEPAAPVDIVPDRPDATVPTAAVWSKLDHKPTKESFKKTAPKADADLDLSAVGDLTPPPPKPVQSDSMLSERAVNAALAEDMATLRKLGEDGWDGLPWHNTVRDVSFRMAKAGLSPMTTISIDKVREMFFDAVPGETDRDKVDEWDRDVETAWESALERAEGEIYELAGSGDELFSDEFDTMLAGVAKATAPAPLDIDDPDLDLDSLGEPEAAKEPLASASDRYGALDLPLVPGFNGASALRVLPLPDPLPVAMENKLRVLGEDISDMHEYEHEEYLHPHCPFCFPESWREQLYRWTIRNPRSDSTDMHPPMGRVAPGEGYVDGLELLGMPDSEMMLDGFLPTSSVGLLMGRHGTGKTFLALDLVMHFMDTSKDKWGLTDIYADDEFGAFNDHGGVMFFAGEGFQSIKSRARAWLKHHGYEDRPDTAPEWLRGLDIRKEVPNFFTGGEDYDRMIERVVKTKPRLVIVDTLQKAAEGSDQNSASDMSVVHGRLARLKSVVEGLTVMVIAHSTKDDTSVRGSSALEDDADFVLHAKKGGANQPNTLEVTKMRDSESPAPLDYFLSPVGHSVVVSSTRAAGTGSMVDERAKIELLTAMHTLRGAKGDNVELVITDIVKQARGMDQADVYTLLGHTLIPSGLATVTDQAGRKYQLTPKGVKWLESRDAAIFARSNIRN